MLDYLLCENTGARRAQLRDSEPKQKRLCGKAEQSIPSSIKRYQLFEWTDLPWLPEFLREAYMDNLNLAFRVSGMMKLVLVPFCRWAQNSRIETVIDLGSGGAGPIQYILNHADTESNGLPKIVVSDLFPQVERYKSIKERYGDTVFDYYEHPISVDALPPDVPKHRTLINVLHHLPPSTAKRIVQRCISDGDGLFICEFLYRDITHLLLVLMSFIPNIVIAMFSQLFAEKPSLPKVIVSAFIPLTGIMIVFDFFVSVLRCYSLEEIEEMLPQENNLDLQIDRGKIPHPLGFSGIYFAVTKRHSVVEGPSKRSPDLRVGQRSSEQYGDVHTRQTVC